MCTTGHFEGDGSGSKVLLSQGPVLAEEGTGKELSSPEPLFAEGKGTSKVEDIGCTTASSSTIERSGS